MHECLFYPTTPQPSRNTTLTSLVTENAIIHHGGGKSVEIEWKLPELHFTDEQAEVQAINPNSARYNAYADTMDKLYRSGNQAVDGFFHGAPQVVKLNVECTGVPKTERFNVLTDWTVRYQG